MVLFNHSTREMTAKIVYYGPGLCGKTTNLHRIFERLDPSRRGKMLSLDTKSDRTLFFDLLPVNIGNIGKFNLKIQLYTVPGQVFYNETRKLVLKGADAVVFVVDSQASMVPSNQESFANLFENMRENQIDPDDTPIIIQYNKRDLLGVLPVDLLATKLSLKQYPSVEAAAVNGTGVMETFELVSKITAKHLVRKLQGKVSGTATLGRTEASDETSQSPEMVESGFDAPSPLQDYSETGSGQGFSTEQNPFEESEHGGSRSEMPGQQNRDQHDSSDSLAASAGELDEQPSPFESENHPVQASGESADAGETDPLLAQEVASFMAMRETRDSGDESPQRDRVRQQLAEIRSEVESLRAAQAELAQTISRSLRELAETIERSQRPN